MPSTKFKYASKFAITVRAFGWLSDKRVPDQKHHTSFTSISMPRRPTHSSSQLEGSQAEYEAVLDLLGQDVLGQEWLSRTLPSIGRPDFSSSSVAPRGLDPIMNVSLLICAQVGYRLVTDSISFWPSETGNKGHATYADPVS